MEFNLTWSESEPRDMKIIEGEWWHPPFDTPLISVGENAAEHLDIKIGTSLEFDIGSPWSSLGGI